MKLLIRVLALVAVTLLTGCITVRLPGAVTFTPPPAATTPPPPGERPTTVPTFTPATARATPSPTSAATRPAGVVGPVIGPDYVLRTDTPSPTFTPTPPSVTPGPSPTPLPVILAQKVGVQIHPFIEEEELIDLLNRAKFDLGMPWVKFQMEWKLMEPGGLGQRELDYQILERFITDAHNRGFSVLLSIVNAPDWARTPVNLAEFPNTPYPEEGPPADYQQFADFVRYIAETFVNRVDAIEVWNEPNLRREWFGKPLGGAEYMRLFDAVYRAVRSSANPNIPLITAGLAPTGINDRVTAVNDRIFLREMYQAGLAQYTNVAIGVHPYGWGNPPSAVCCDANPGRGWADQPFFFFRDTMEAYRAIMEEFGHADGKMWITEFGWPSFDGFGVEPDPAIAFIGYVSEWDQAHYLIEALAYLNAQPYVERSFIWNLNWAIFMGRDGIQPLEQEAAYALIRPDGSPRPAYLLIQQSPKEGAP